MPQAANPEFCPMVDSKRRASILSVASKPAKGVLGRILPGDVSENAYQELEVQSSGI